MHVYFSGIGGTGIGPLALIAKQAGYEVSGSDKQDSQYIAYLRKHGLNNIHIGQSEAAIADLHAKHPIDWLVYSSAVEKENAKAPELQFAERQAIELTKRDAFINQLLKDKHLKLIAVAGTHGKTTTTAMIVWLCKQLKLPISYTVPAKFNFGEMGEFEPKAEYFIYEADEFDRNFLAFEPYVSVISGVSWDHHEIFPTREDYQQAFLEFISQSKWTILWQDDADYLGLGPDGDHDIEDPAKAKLQDINLVGHYNRLDAWLAVKAVQEMTGADHQKLIGFINKFPGAQRRMEQIIPNLYTDYAHTPDKIKGAMSVAREMAEKSGQKVIIVYEPLTNRRQHYILDDYKDCFDGADHIYWVPSYLAREDSSQHILSPEELITHLSNPHLAEPAELNDVLAKSIQKHLDEGDMVVCMSGGGGNSLDEWVRETFNN